MTSIGSGSGSQYSTPTPAQYSTPSSIVKHEAHTPHTMPPNQLQPTWTGYVADTYDALVLFQGAIDGVLRKVVRRPHDRERPEVIRSGAVFIYEESASGIKRWTDGVPWSPSRILGNFLIYRELEKPFPPGEKKRATKKVKSPRPGDPYPPPDRPAFEYGLHSPAAGPNSIPETPPPLMPSQGHMTPTRPMGGHDSSSTTDRDSERSLVGSLTDSYAFKDGGLVKKTLSINHEGGHLHLVSYYNPADVREERLKMRQDDERVNHIQVRPELIQQQNFRSPIDSSDDATTPASGGASSSAPASSASSYRPALPGHYVGAAPGAAQAPFMPNQYHLPQQSMGHTGSSYYPNMGPAHPSAHHMQGSYSYPPYADFYKGIPTTTPQPAPQSAYQSMDPGSNMHMHPDQSSYMQQSSYQIQDNRTHTSDSYGDPSHMKSEWNDGHR